MLFGGEIKLGKGFINLGTTNAIAEIAKEFARALKMNSSPLESAQSQQQVAMIVFYSSNKTKVADFLEMQKRFLIMHQGPVEIFDFVLSYAELFQGGCKFGVESALDPIAGRSCNIGSFS